MPNSKEKGFISFQKFNKSLTKLLKSRPDASDIESDDFIQSIIDELSTQVDDIRSYDNPDLWKKIYIQRDNAKIRVEVFNRLMSMGAKS